MTQTGFQEAQRIVVKVGSMLLVDPARQEVRRAWMDTLTEDLFGLIEAEKEVIVVASGAVTMGRRHIGRPSGPLTLEQKQAAAACGQAALSQAFAAGFQRFARHAAQVLLTLSDTEDRRRFLNARHTLETLLEHGVVPVINENDTLATQSIRFGDNDRLSARIAQMLMADTLVILSDVDGLYTGNPDHDPKAEWIPEVHEVTPEIEMMASAPANDFGSGGMITKLSAAKIAMAAGCHMVLAKGAQPHPLRRIMEGERCTWFVAPDNPLSARSSWIAGTLRPAGTVVIDAGAVKALHEGNSLLPVGVVDARGDFERGDAVSVVDSAGVEIARGLIAYNRHDTLLIKGKHSREVESILGYPGRTALIHRSDLVMM